MPGDSIVTIKQERISSSLRRPGEIDRSSLNGAMTRLIVTIAVAIRLINHNRRDLALARDCVSISLAQRVSVMKPRIELNFAAGAFSLSLSLSLSSREKAYAHSWVNTCRNRANVSHALLRKYGIMRAGYAPTTRYNSSAVANWRDYYFLIASRATCII